MRLKQLVAMLAVAVAAGALPERGRGMEEINHGRTRTVLTNVRFLLDKGECRCTCGEAVRLPEAEGQTAKRYRSVLIIGCGMRRRICRRISSASG